MNARANPAQVEKRLMPMAMRMECRGWLLSSSAVAAGAVNNANTSNTPTTWTDIEMVTTRITMNRTENNHKGNPLDSARVGSTDSNRRGRKIAGKHKSDDHT